MNSLMATPVSRAVTRLVHHVVLEEELLYGSRQILSITWAARMSSSLNFWMSSPTSPSSMITGAPLDEPLYKFTGELTDEPLYKFTDELIIDDSRRAP
jgi:hypothetical protein